ncbi:MAG: hypothetical protein LUF01_11780, partial [Bacteroides sp.]|nr:hypothetical protein [Bacteroides sp.]
QLEVFCKAADGETLNDVQATWGNIKSIKLLDAYPQMTYNYTTSEITGTGEKKAISLLKPDYTDFAPGTEIQANDVTTPIAVGMYAPAKLVILCITTEATKIVNGTETTEELIRTFAVQFVDNNTPVDFESGKKYTVNILFSEATKDPQIATTVDSWTINSETPPSDGLGGNQGVDAKPGEWDKNDSDGDCTSDDVIGDIGKNPTT